TESRHAGQRSFEPASIRILQSEAVENVQTLAGKREIDAVRTHAKVVDQPGIDDRGQLQGGILSALRSAGSAQAGKEIGVIEIRVNVPVEGVAHRQGFLL